MSLADMSWRRIGFHAILFYYWIILNSAHLFITRTHGVVVFSPLYFIMVLPICAFIAVAAASLLKASVRKDVLWLIGFTLLVIITAFIKGDPYAAVGLTLLTVTIAVILEGRLFVSTTFLNRLYLASVVWVIITAMSGVNPYGFLPWGSIAEVYGLGWRVSLFPYSVVGSALFSLVVLIANIGVRAPHRKLVVPLAIYFGLFSANRTVTICMALLAVFLVLTHFIDFRRRRTYKWLIPASLAAFFTAVALLPLLAVATMNQQEWLTGLIFHRKSLDEIEMNIDRVIIWQNHIQVFAANPLIGGTNRDIIEAGVESVSTGSESFLTRVAALTGLVTLLIVMAFRAALRRTMASGNLRGYAALLVLPILALSYGSFIVPYDFTFLVMISFLAVPAATVAQTGGRTGSSPLTAPAWVEP